MGLFWSQKSFLDGEAGEDQPQGPRGGASFALPGQQQFRERNRANYQELSELDRESELCPTTDQAIRSHQRHTRYVPPDPPDACGAEKANAKKKKVPNECDADADPYDVSEDENAERFADEAED